ncbi:MAG: hypothetical protein CMO44_19460 [Verrucomicrobiales bacterium]|nr:hypothetical protein [Verrucomicrobiales bacterium]
MEEIRDAFWIDGKNHYLDEMPLDLLIECGSNAAATCSCLGHHKGERNEAHFRMVNQELERRQEPKLLFSEAMNNGEFNGKGSY